MSYKKYGCFISPHHHHESGSEPHPSVRLEDDFYEVVNAEWLAETVIPEDRPSMSSFGELDLAIEKLEQPLFEEMLAHPEKAPSELAEFLNYFALARDFAAREEVGFSPLLPPIQKINALDSFADFWQQAPELLRQGWSLPFLFSVEPDMKQADRYTLSLNPTPLLLKDRSFYEENQERGLALKETLRKIGQELAPELDYSAEEIDKLFSQAFAFDERLYPYTKTAEDAADYPSYCNPVSTEEVQTFFASYPLAVFEPLLGRLPEKVNVSHLPFLHEGLAEIIAPEHFAELKAWLLVQFITDNLSILTQKARELEGLLAQTLFGTKKIAEKEKAAFKKASYFFSQVIGRYYGEHYFGEQAKADVTSMVKAMIQIYRNRLAENDWLAPETKAKAIQKLDTIAIHVGYPEKIPAYYADLVVEPGESFYETHQKFTALYLQDYFSKVGKAVERDLWEMSADTVNAYYNPFGNEIVFPAAILQAPFYSLDQSVSTNMGGIGAVIAHEISHAFDNNGAQFDEKGNLANWWQEADNAAFKERAQAMIDQFDQLPFGDGHVNGTLTVSENIADAGGLSCALEAAQQDPAFSVTEFFENWARSWRNLASPELTNMLLNMDVHAPAKLRANVQPKNFADFFEAYAIQPDDAMYLPPEKRVHIW